MKPLVLKDFSGGLNEVSENAKIKENETPYCKNVIFTDQGALEKRPGYRSILNTPLADPITGLYLYHKKNGTYKFIVTSGTDIYTIDIATGATTSIKTGLTSGKYFSFTTLGDICYMTNGEDTLMSYDGTTITDETVQNSVGSSIYCKYVVDHYNNIFMAGEKFNPSTLYFYELAAGAVGFTSSDVQEIEVSTDDGDEITGIARQLGNLVIFKNNSIHVLYGSSPNDFALQMVHPNIGCVAPRSIVNINNYLYFLAKDGIYTFDGTNVNLISRNIQPSIQKIANFDKTCGAYYDYAYFLSYPEGSSTTPDTVLVYSFLHKAWSKFKGINANCFNNFDGSEDGRRGLNTLYFGGTNGQVYLYDSGTSDDGNPIEMRYETKRFDLGADYITKTFRNLLVKSQSSQGVTLEYVIDKGVKSGSISLNGSESNPLYLWGESDWGTLQWRQIGPIDDRKSLRGGTYGKEIKFIFTENSMYPAEVFSLALKFRARRERW